MPCRIFRAILIILLGVVIGCEATSAQNAPLTWWVVGSTVKVLPTAVPPAQPETPILLHAARREYVPFQIVLRANQIALKFDALSVSYPEEYFGLQLYREQYVPMLHVPDPEIVSLARLTDAGAIPDGLRPFDSPFEVRTEQPTVIWADLYVQPETPPGDYTLTLTIKGMGERRVTVRVYPVDLEPQPAVTVIIPEDADWTIPFFGGDDPTAFHRAMNTLLLAHGVVPGTFVAQPVMIADGWDFSPLDAELDALPAGAFFYAPLPYDDRSGQYLLRDEHGRPYQQAMFDDPQFVRQAEAFFRALADYLRSKDRLEGALVYPDDETRWVGDEPWHAGPRGYARLSRWTAIVRVAGLRVTASGVDPVPPGPAELGWLDPDLVTDDTHVHVDVLDAAPEVFAAWMSRPGKSSSVYLNEYGDLIDLTAAIQRGLIWHVYARDVRMIAGYSALEWVGSEDYDLVDPWQDVTALYPVSGYGGGALVWPGPQPSIRLKLLREGLEDTRLLDLYAQATSPEEARDLARQLTPGPLAHQNPPADLWDQAHEALLVALTEGERADFSNFRPLPAAITQDYLLIDFDRLGQPEEWGFTGVTAEVVESPWAESGQALRLTFDSEANEAGLWFETSDWEGWRALQFEVRSLSPYFTTLDVGLTDADGHYLLLPDKGLLLGPNADMTVTLPLLIPMDETEPFDWSQIRYFSLQVATSYEARDGFGQWGVYPLGSRTLILDNFRLVK